MISGRLMNLARLDIIVLLQIDTRCAIDKRTSKWYGYYTQKWFFTQVLSFVMLVQSNQRQSAMKLTYPAPCRGGLVQYECIKEKEHEIHIHSFNTPRKGGNPQTRVGWTVDHRSCCVGESCRACVRGQLLRRVFELFVLADTCCHHHYCRLLDG